MSQRREEKVARREERLRLEREEAERARRRQRMGYLVAAGLVLATIVIVVLALSSGGGSDKPTPAQRQTATQAAAAAGCVMRSFPSEGRGHTTGTVAYRTNPPTSGNHNPVAAPDQEYGKAPPAVYYVHSLEHGRIELQYRPGSPAATVAAVRAVFNSDPSKMLMFPNNTSMPYAVAATAWRHLLGCPAYNARVPAALTAFRDAYRDKGPEVVP